MDNFINSLYIRQGLASLPGLSLHYRPRPILVRFPGTGPGCLPPGKTGKTQGIWNGPGKTGKTQGIWYGPGKIENFAKI